MVQKDLILDFNLYLCEKFGYRESCSVMSHANGFCIAVEEATFPTGLSSLCAVISKRTKKKA